MPFRPGTTLIRTYFGGDLNGTETEYTVSAVRYDKASDLWAFRVAEEDIPGWTLWQPEEGQWRIA